MMRLPLSLLFPALLVPAQANAAQGQASRASSASASLAVPVGTIIPLEIKNTINSRTAYVGEAIYSETTYPVTQGDRILIPAHSYVKGSVTEVVRPGHIKGKAQLGLRFDSITLPDGTTRPLQAKVFSLAGCRLSDSKTEEASAEQAEGQDIAVSGAQDAFIDASGLGGASPISAASEGVGGLVVMLVTRGKTILLRPGTTLEIQLTAPLSFSRVDAQRFFDKAKPPALSRRPPSPP